MRTNQQRACAADSLRIFEQFFESSKVLHKELAHLRHAATTNLTILITGEGGTGKELVACAVHHFSIVTPGNSSASTVRRSSLSSLLPSYSVNGN